MPRRRLRAACHRSCGGDAQCRRGGRRLQLMHVRGDLCTRQRVGLFACLLAKSMTSANVNGHPALQVGQAEVHSPITAEGGA